MLFTVVSRLGDGGIRYLLLLILAASVASSALVAGQMAATGVVATAVYRLLKVRLVRERPYVADSAIELGTAPLDRCSFPSGHTLHAVCFTILSTTGALIGAMLAGASLAVWPA